MLNIRRFVQGRDEDVWVSVWNKAFREFDDFRSISVEDWRTSEKSPTFDAAGMFIAELDKEPVGIVNAYVDKMRRRRKGSYASWELFQSIAEEEQDEHWLRKP